MWKDKRPPNWVNPFVESETENNYVRLSFSVKGMHVPPEQFKLAEVVFEAGADAMGKAVEEWLQAVETREYDQDVLWHCIRDSDWQEFIGAI